MPYVATASLPDMIQPEACATTASRIADDGTDAFQANVRRNTPIDTSPFRDRPGRPRGALRESVDRGPVRRVTLPVGPAYRSRVFTLDPIAEFVEWDTAPHEIVARPGSALRWTDAGGEHFAKRVMHPGTVGAHMFSIGAAITEAELPAIASPALKEWEIAVTRSSFRIVDRRAR